MSDVVAAINAGSSSIKFSLFETGAPAGSQRQLVSGEVSGLGNEPKIRIIDRDGNTIMARPLSVDADHEKVIGEILDWIIQEMSNRPLVGAGHRVVHGGMDFSTPILIDADVIEKLEALIPLAPLHQPHNITAIRALRKLRPSLPQVACFDTGFHHTNGALATTFALPRSLTDEGVRRYGFHGLSYEYIASVLPDYAGSGAGGRVVVAHLGHGASMCAMLERRSVASTMGFTALDGLMMGTRCGSLDPGVLLFLMKEKSMDFETICDLLYHRSGLLGVSGISDDMRALLASKSETAKEAVDLFVYRINRELGSLTAALGGLDILVFTGGIGEHATIIRERVCRDSEWVGVKFDVEANACGKGRISTPDGAVQVFTIPTNEDLMIAKHTVALIDNYSAKKSAKLS